MRYLTFVFIALFCWSCGNQIESKPVGKLPQISIHSLDNALMLIGRFKILSSDSSVLELEKFKLDTTQNRLGFVIAPEQLNDFSSFLEKNQDKIKMGAKVTFIKHPNKTNEFYAINSVGNVLNHDIISSEILEDSLLRITINENGMHVLKNISLENVNRPCVLQINGHPVSFVQQFGELENNELTLPYHELP